MASNCFLETESKLSLPYSDDNAKRRNLIILSTIILLYFFSGAHVPEEKELGLPIVNLVAESPWVIYAFFWVALFISYRAFVNASPSYIECYKEEVDGFRLKCGKSDDVERDYLKNFPDGYENKFIKELKQFSDKVGKQQFEKIQRLNYEGIKFSNRAETEPVKFQKARVRAMKCRSVFGIQKLYIHMQYTAQTLGQSSRRELTTSIAKDLNFRQSIQLFIIHIRRRNHFLEIVFPKALALLAFFTGVSSIHGVWPIVGVAFIYGAWEACQQAPLSHYDPEKYSNHPKR